jgi:CRISPR-associated protein Cas1
MLKPSDTPLDPAAALGEPPRWSFDFQGRNRRPPRDPVNALLSLAYSLLAKDFTVTCAAVGFDPYLGFYHLPRPGRPALALDLMEPFRSLVADSVVITAINNRMIYPEHCIAAGRAVTLTESGRKALFRAYEQRMDQLVTHPLFDYRVSYRRLLEIQTRLMARVITGELSEYPVFVTR